MANIIWFEFDNWTAGEDFPREEPFFSWMYPTFNKDKDLSAALFNDADFVKENELVVLQVNIDMSIDYIIGAKDEWVIAKCPSLLNKYRDFIVGITAAEDKEESYIVSRYLSGLINVMYNEKTKGRIFCFDEDTCDVDYDIG